MTEREKWLQAAFSVRDFCTNKEEFDHLILSRWLKLDKKYLPLRPE